jgi:hypothetical protein
MYNCHIRSIYWHYPLAVLGNDAARGLNAEKSRFMILWDNSTFTAQSDLQSPCLCYVMLATMQAQGKQPVYPAKRI